MVMVGAIAVVASPGGNLPVAESFGHSRRKQLKSASPVNVVETVK